MSCLDVLFHFGWVSIVVKFIIRKRVSRFGNNRSLVLLAHRFGCLVVDLVKAKLLMSSSPSSS